MGNVGINKLTIISAVILIRENNLNSEVTKNRIE